MIDLYNVSLQFGGKYLFKEVNLKINAGERICLVGPNGAGKSSLLKIIFGQFPPESGKIIKQKRITIGYLPQENVTHFGKTLIEEAESALADIFWLREKENEITEQLNSSLLNIEEKNDLINQLGEVHFRLEELGSYSTKSKVEKVLIGLGFEEKDFLRRTEEFSGGWQMRIALAKILIAQNDILLMDEPTNHLDLDSLDWLISFMKSFKGALIVVSHDKYFVNEVTNKTLEIYLGKFNSYNGKYENFLKFKTERDRLAEAQLYQQQQVIKQTQKFIDRFRSKNTKAKQVQSRIKMLEKMELVELEETKDEITIKFPPVVQSGRINIELSGVSKSYGQNNIFSNLDFVVERGEKIAFVGPNGAGKTTLSKIISDQVIIDSGKRNVGYNTFISYYAQDVSDNLNLDLDVLETIYEMGSDKSLSQIRSLLGCFLFSGDDVFKKVGVLSGGEKSRVALIKVLLTKANLIVLDEPTNHLDISSKAILQKALIDFNGSLILVSHDIDFLRPIVNRVVEIRKGVVKNFVGGIDYYLQKRKDAFSSGNEDGEKKETTKPIVDRKEQKRLEADLRKKRYESTKGISEEIKKLETLIEKLEKNKSEIELALTDEKIYSVPSLIKEKNSEYASVKNKLEAAINKWTELSEKLLKIEKNFS